MAVKWLFLFVEATYKHIARWRVSFRSCLPSFRTFAAGGF